jgi:flagellar basal body-associated protein FliL
MPDTGVSDMPVHHDAKPPATSRRIAWVAVIIMSVLLVLALLGTVWGFIRQAHILMGPRPAVPAASLPAGAAATVMLAPGARIVSATTDAGKLVLHVTTPSGDEVEIIDLASGKLTGQVSTPPK